MKLTAADLERHEKSEVHRAKSSALVACAVKVLDDYESIQLSPDQRIELAIEFLEQARFEIGHALYTPPGRMRSTRSEAADPKKAKK